MADTETTHAAANDDAHGDDHGHGHESASEPLGPVDLTTWAYALAGSILALLVVVALVVARGV